MPAADPVKVVRRLVRGEVEVASVPAVRTPTGLPGRKPNDVFVARGDWADVSSESDANVWLTPSRAVFSRFALKKCCSEAAKLWWLEGDPVSF
jgi:hypothetical protein